MRPSSNSGRRPRGRPNRKHGQGQPGRNQSLDSGGPEGRIRGNAGQIYERYLALARDANSSGDRVAAETFFQHAEHYYRVVNDSTDPEPLNPGARPRRGEEANGQDAELAGNGRGHSEGKLQGQPVDQSGGHARGQSRRPPAASPPAASPPAASPPAASAPVETPDDAVAGPGPVAAEQEAALQPAIAGLEPQPDLAESIPAAIPIARPADDAVEEAVKPRRGRAPRKRLTTKRAAPAQSETAPDPGEAASQSVESDEQAPDTAGEAEKA